MNLILAFVPFVVFAIVDHLGHPMQALIAGAAASALLILWDVLRKGHTPKILEAGTLLLFIGLAIYWNMINPAWTVIGVRLRVDIGLLVIILLSIACRFPFTLQYAREQLPRAEWTNPAVIRTNYVISLIWAAAFAIIVLAEFAALSSVITRRMVIIAIALALVGAFKATQACVARARKRNAA
jgi:signal transduction histidine kinase